jgi:uncharacterized protein
MLANQIQKPLPPAEMDTNFNLETAVQDDKVMQDFELESLSMGVDHSQKVKATPIESDYSSKDCVNLSSSTAFSRFKDLNMKTADVNIKTLIANAAEIIAPLWSMQTIIARNPLQCIESLNFEDAIAIGETLLTGTSDMTGNASSEVNREMVKWCQVFLDEGQATITMPEREKGFYHAWSVLAPFDNKLRSYKKNEWLLSLPCEAEEAIFFCLKRLTIPDEQIEEYLKYLLAELPGWAGYIKWRTEWQNKEVGLKNPITLTDFLAVRLVITCAIEKDYQKRELKKEAIFIISSKESTERKAADVKDRDEGIASAIFEERSLADALCSRPIPDEIVKVAKKDASHSKALDKEFFKELKRKEEKYLQTLLKLAIPEVVKLNKRKEPLSKPDAQIVFCIDVRSEPFRMRIEREGNYETFGFAGFFGLPVSIHSYNTDQVKDCCPVLIKPGYEVFEEPISEENERISYHEKGRSFLIMCRGFYQDLKYNFATPFALVETLGLWCGFWMAIRTIMPISSVKFKQVIQEKLKPTLETLPRIDIPLPNQIIFGESALRMIGLTKNFSRLVVLCGHGSQTENNPYASALECGACGGNHGGPNGKILATILNSYEVRAALLEKGIAIPDDTLFLGAEHNTTTDEVVIYDRGIVNITHKEIAEKLKADFIKAGIVNSQYRCRTFGLDTSPINAKKHVLRRSSNWAEVRPEWGLARNAAFIIGPRNLTKDLDLEGRCFLHSYKWEEDEGGKSLETILTAPMVIAEWINTQYFFSTLNNIAYGSGSKITHNVTGKFGVMQGNGSDLMQGLPLQSVNINDDHCYHEPMRLQVVVYAPRSRLESIIEKHAILQTLLFNRWVILVAIDPIDSKPYRLIGKAEWVEIKVDNDINSSCKTNPVNFTTLEKKVKKYSYNDKTCVIATMHEKEKVIAPPFLDLLGLKMIKAKIDTDQLGTFNGEVKRKGTPLTCVRQKCELAMKESKVTIGIASEGSFGPHPFIPFFGCDHEILYFMDQERDFSLHQSLLSTKTNHCVEAFSDPQRLKTFCDQSLFPSHGLIVKPNKFNKKTFIIKGIQTYDVLEDAFLKCCRLSEDGNALVETDMRAHMNPTRMEVIKELADSFAKRLATPCPLCYNPGWGVVDTQKGLECDMCGSETEMVKSEVFGCPKCLHKENRLRQDGLTVADPQYCGWCNP